jgi:hypothetical protein
MNLYLDDIRNPPPGEWVVVRTAEDAKVLLASGLVEYASLDHDLGPCPQCTESEETEEGIKVVAAYPCPHSVTGYDLVKWMEETDNWPKYKPMVHSANPVGKANMIRAIERHY